MPTTLPPVLLRAAVVDRQTLTVTPPWLGWFEASFLRQGGQEAQTNTELEADLTTTNDALKQTQADLAATQADLAQTQQELDQTQADLAQTQQELDQTQEDLAGTQGEVTALEAELAAKLPDGTPLSVARYQADGSGVETTPGMVTTSDGRLGIGLAPEVAVGLEVAGNLVAQRDAANTGLTLRSYGLLRTVLTGLVAQGTAATPGATTATQQLLRLEGRGHDGVAATGARLLIDYQPTETFTPTAQGTRLVVSTTLTGTTTTAERLRIDGNGFLGVGGVAPTAPLDVQGDTLRLRTARTPASATAPGNAGEVCWDSTGLYVCIATNTWRKATLATF